MNLLYTMIQLVNTGLQVYFSTIFYSSFSKLKHSAKILILSEVFSILLMTCGLILFKENLIVYLFTLLPLLLLTFLFECSIVSKILYFLLYNAVVILSEILVASVSTLITHIAFNNFSETAHIISIMVSKLLVLNILTIIRLLKCRKFFDCFRFKNLKACMVPFASLLIITMQFVLLKENINQNTYLSYLLLASDTIWIITNTIVFDYIHLIRMHETDKEKIAMANDIITQQAIQYNDFIKHSKDIIKMQHNSKHFHLGLISALEAGRYSEALSQLKMHFNENSNAISSKSGNIIYSIIEIMKLKAAKYNTKIDFTYTELRPIKILSTDLAIILGNALDNAIEACSKLNNKEKIIQLFIQPQNETIIITVKNPVIEDIDTLNFTSTKPYSKWHGYGIISMKEIAAKYGGNIALTCTNHLFTVSAILNNISLDNE